MESYRKEENQTVFQKYSKAEQNRTRKTKGNCARQKSASSSYRCSDEKTDFNSRTTWNRENNSCSYNCQGMAEKVG